MLGSLGIFAGLALPAETTVKCVRFLEVLCKGLAYR